MKNIEKIRESKSWQESFAVAYRNQITQSAILPFPIMKKRSKHHRRLNNFGRRRCMVLYTFGE